MLDNSHDYICTLFSMYLAISSNGIDITCAIYLLLLHDEQMTEQVPHRIKLQGPFQGNHRYSSYFQCITIKNSCLALS